MSIYRLYFLVAACFVTLLFSGCQKDSVMLSIEMGNFTSDNKVYVDGYTSYWSDGDNLVINDEEVGLSGNGRSVRVTVPSAAMYKAVFPAEYVGEDMQHLNIPNMQPYVTDDAGHQLVKFPMGAYSDNGTTLHFTPMSSLLAIQISNTTEHGTMIVDRVSVSASHAALWGEGTIHNITFDTRSYTIDAGYIAGLNDCVVLSGENGQGMNLSVNQNETKTVYVSIPPIPEDVSNKFTVTVHAYQDGEIPLSYSFCFTCSCTGNNFYKCIHWSINSLLLLCIKSDFFLFVSSVELCIFYHSVSFFLCFIDDFTCLSFFIIRHIFQCLHKRNPGTYAYILL